MCVDCVTGGQRKKERKQKRGDRHGADRNSRREGVASRHAHNPFITDTQPTGVCVVSRENTRDEEEEEEEAAPLSIRRPTALRLVDRCLESSHARASKCARACPFSLLSLSQGAHAVEYMNRNSHDHIPIIIRRTIALKRAHIHHTHIQLPASIRGSCPFFFGLRLPFSSSHLELLARGRPARSNNNSNETAIDEAVAVVFAAAAGAQRRSGGNGGDGRGN